MHRPLRVMRFVVLGVFFDALSCGGGTVAPGSRNGTMGMQPTAPTPLKSDAGDFLLTIQTDPDPPIRGTNTVTYTVSDASARSVDGLTLAIVPWMPAHGHGTSVHPTIVPHGKGVYEIQDVLFFMPGLWELRSTLTSSVGPDHATPSFTIP